MLSEHCLNSESEFFITSQQHLRFCLLFTGYNSIHTTWQTRKKGILTSDHIALLIKLSALIQNRGKWLFWFFCSYGNLLHSSLELGRYLCDNDFEYQRKQRYTNNCGHLWLKFWKMFTVAFNGKIANCLATFFHRWSWILPHICIYRLNRLMLNVKSGCKTMA